MKKPSFEHLESLLAFVRHGSIEVAAQKLNISQPALSMQLKKLEEIFEYPIFEFQGKRKKLTPFGISVYEEALEIISNYNSSFEQLYRKYSEPKKQRLRIGCRRELISKVVESIRFEGSISFFPMSSEQGVDNLIKNGIDLAVSRIKPESPDIVAKKFFTSGSSLVVHKKWIKSKPSYRIISDKQFLTMTPGLAYGDTAELFKSWTNHLGLNFDSLNIKFRIEDWISLLQLVELGEGYSIMPNTVRSNANDVEHIEIPHDLVPANPHYFLFHRGLRKFPAFKDLFKSNLD